MAATTFDTKNRNVIPRWRDSQLTRDTPEAASSSTRPIRRIDERQFREKEDDWEYEKSTVSAAELLNAAIVMNRADAAQDAATFLITTKERVPEPIKSLAHAILNKGGFSGQLGFPATIYAKEHIKRLRQTIHQYPRNAIAWVDLAREYAALGQRDRSKHAMSIAVSLAPDNRFVLRSAARLYVHTDDPKQAHDVLTRSAASISDPWLIAAELAVARVANAVPEFAFQARQLLRLGKHAPSHLSEMTSALATLELDNGAAKQARRLFKQALRDPTENTVAQVGWASQQLGRIPMEESVLEVPRLFEAKAWGTFWSGNWAGALEHSWNWLDDQPFSSRPVVHGSYVASTLLEDFTAAESILRTGLIANPKDPGLLNNLVVTLAKTGRIDEALKYFSMIDHGSLNALRLIVWKATKGLLLFRLARFEEGRLLYKNAIENANTEDLHSLRMQAAVALAFEEIEASTAEVIHAGRLALDIAKGQRGPVTDTLVSRLMKRLRDLGPTSWPGH